MDPISAISFVASLAQLIDAGTKVVGYLNDVRTAAKARGELSVEVANILTLLIRLRLRVEESQTTNQTWLSSLKALTDPPDGALVQLEAAYTIIDEKLASPSSSIVTKLQWHFDKKKIDLIQAKLHRVQNLINLALQDDTIQFLQAIKEDTAKLTEIGTNISKLNAAVNLRNKTPNDFQNICNILSPLNFLNKQRDIINSMQQGTGQWFLQNETFQKWTTGSGQKLWCPGIPGAGKTVLSALAFEKLSSQSTQDSGAIAACVFCDYAEKDSQTPSVLLGSVWRQIANPEIEKLQDAHKLHQDCITTGMTPTCDQIKDLLHPILSSRRAYIIVDALDECAQEPGRDHRSLFLKHLLNLSEATGANIMFTSRTNDDTLSFISPDYIIPIEAYERDLTLYIMGRLKENRRLVRNIQRNPSLESEIVSTVLEKSRDMFLLARLHMDSLAMAITPGSVKRTLSDLPTSYTPTYDQAMQRIAAQYPEEVNLARKVLSWTAFALRPLTVDEMRHAVSIIPEDRDLNEFELPDEELLTAVCAGLVVVDHDTKLLRLVHKTTKEYFSTESNNAYFRLLNNDLTSTCISYLRFGPLTSGPYRSQEEFDQFLEKYKFFAYAAQFWGDHARGQPEFDLRDEIMAFLNDERKLQVAIQARNIQPGHYSYNLHPKKVTTIGYVASFGLVTLIKHIFSSFGTKDINSKDSFGATPLLRAAEAGHPPAVRLLLDYGADPNIPGPSGITPLIAAAYSGSQIMVNDLLLFGADLHAKSSGWSIRGIALEVALAQGHTHLTRTLSEALSPSDRIELSRPCSHLHVQFKADQQSQLRQQRGAATLSVRPMPVRNLHYVDRRRDRTARTVYSFPDSNDENFFKDRELAHIEWWGRAPLPKT